MIRKIAFGLLIALSTSASAGGFNPGPVQDDLKSITTGNSRAVWLIYGPFSMEKVDDAIALLAPFKERIRVGITDTDGRNSMLLDKLNAEGFTICKDWGTGLKFGSAQKPKGDGNYLNDSMWGALLASNTDLLAVKKDAAGYEEAATEWQMGGAVDGAAKANIVIADLLSEENDPSRITDDNAVGAAANLQYADENRGRDCLTK